MERNLRAMNKKLNNCSGQALIETFACVLALKMFVAGFLFLFFQIVLTQWVDFWSYRTLICVIETRQKYLCQKKLEEKLNLLLSPKNYRIQELWLTHKQTKIKLVTEVFPFGKKSYLKQIELPLLPP